MYDDHPEAAHALDTVAKAISSVMDSRRSLLKRAFVAVIPATIGYFRTAFRSSANATCYGEMPAYCDYSSLVCVDLASNDRHCGECDNWCGPDQRCEMGSCVCGPISGGTNCPSGNGITCAYLDFDPSNCGFCGNSCDWGHLCYNGVCDGYPTATTVDPFAPTAEYRFAFCGFSISWQTPWSQQTGISLEPHDFITLLYVSPEYESVILQIFGIPLNELGDIGRPLNDDQVVQAVAMAYVDQFRAGMPNLRILQQASADEAMVIEYDMLEGGSVREFIFGGVLDNSECAFISVLRTDSSYTLPNDFGTIMDAVVIFPD